MGIERQRAWATMGKARLVFGDYGHKTPAGLGYYGQKSAWFWATMGKVYSGLGDYGHNHPRVWATMGKTRSVFGLPWAKFTWVWAITGKVYLGLGYHGQSLSAFGLLRAQPFITAGLCDGGPL